MKGLFAAKTMPRPAAGDLGHGPLGSSVMRDTNPGNGLGIFTRFFLQFEGHAVIYDSLDCRGPNHDNDACGWHEHT